MYPAWPMSLTPALPGFPAGPASAPRSWELPQQPQHPPLCLLAVVCGIHSRQGNSWSFVKVWDRGKFVWMQRKTMHSSYQCAGWTNGFNDKSVQLFFQVLLFSQACTSVFEIFGSVSHILKTHLPLYFRKPFNDNAPIFLFSYLEFFFCQKLMILFAFSKDQLKK